MTTETAKRKGNHTLYIEERERLVVTDVTDVANFNEDAILLSIERGGIIIKGQNLHIQKLDLEEGKVIITGFIISCVYTEKKEKQDKGFLGKILK